MIAWFGPAVLLVLLAASNLPASAAAADAAATAVMAEDFGITIACIDGISPAQRTAVASAAGTLPRELPRNRLLRGFGLPRPRAPTC